MNMKIIHRLKPEGRVKIVQILRLQQYPQLVSAELKILSLSPLENILDSPSPPHQPILIFNLVCGESI